MLILQRKTGTGAIPDWSSPSEGSSSSLNGDFGNKGILQNVGGEKIIGLYVHDGTGYGASLQSYTFSGSTFAIDAEDLNFHTGGNIVGYSLGATKLETDKALVTYRQPGGTDNVATVVTTGTGTISSGTPFTFPTQSVTTQVAALTSTEVIAASRQVSGITYTQLKKLTVSGTTVSSTFDTNLSNVTFGVPARIDDTHATVVLRNLSPTQWEVRNFTMGGSSFTQAGVSVTIPEFTQSDYVGVIRLRDDGDGIVFVTYTWNDFGSAIKKALAFKVNTTTFATTKGPVITLSGSAYNFESVRPITRLSDTQCMVTIRDSISVLTIDPSLNITELNTSTTDSTYDEVEFIDDTGTSVFRRTRFTGNVVTAS